MLAGDTCKEASDLGIPFVGVGFFYPEGFFRQRIESDGVQEAVYQRLDPNKAPLLPVLNDDGSRLLSSVPVGKPKHTADRMEDSGGAGSPLPDGH